MSKKQKLFLLTEDQRDICKKYFEIRKTIMRTNKKMDKLCREYPNILQKMNFANK